MAKLKTLISQYPLGAYFSLAYLVSWVIWAPMIALYLQHKPESMPLPYLVIAGVGVYGPTIAAVLVTAVIEGRVGVHRLLGKYRLWRFSPGWYALILLIFPQVYILGTLAYVYLSHDVPDLHPEVLVRIPIIFLLSIPFGPLGEELGWRGFALPHLRRRFSWVGVNFVLGFLWFSWHIPAMFVPGIALPNVPVNWNVLLQYGLMILGFTFLFSLIYCRTGGSVFMSILLHTSINTTAQVINPLFWGQIGVQRQMPVLWSVTAILWVVLLIWTYLHVRSSQAVKRGYDMSYKNA